MNVKIVSLDFFFILWTIFQRVAKRLVLKYNFIKKFSSFNLHKQYKCCIFVGAIAKCILIFY